MVPLQTFVWVLVGAQHLVKTINTMLTLYLSTATGFSTVLCPDTTFRTAEMSTLGFLKAVGFPPNSTVIY